MGNVYPPTAMQHDQFGATAVVLAVAAVLPARFEYRQVGAEVGPFGSIAIKPRQALMHVAALETVGAGFCESLSTPQAHEFYRVDAEPFHHLGHPAGLPLDSASHGPIASGNQLQSPSKKNEDVEQ